MAEYNNELLQLLKEIKSLALLFHKRDWAESNAGNFSVNVTDIMNGFRSLDLIDSEKFLLDRSYVNMAGQYFLMSGAGVRFRDIASAATNDNLVLFRISDDGESGHYIINDDFDFALIRPTSELPTHLAIHELIQREGLREKAIFHTHVNELIALSHNKELKDSAKLTSILYSMHPEVIISLPEGIDFYPIFTGHPKIAEATAEMVKKHKVILWEKHGVFAVGDSPASCFDSIDIIAKAAKIYLLCKLYGFEPEGISEKDILELKNHFGI